MGISGAPILGNKKNSIITAKAIVKAVKEDDVATALVFIDDLRKELNKKDD